MEELYLGIELDDTSCKLSWINPVNESAQELVDESGQSRILAFLCLNGANGCWSIGTEAEKACGKPGNIVFKNLLTLLRSGQKLEVNGVFYTGEDLLQEFLKLVWKEAQIRSGLEQIGKLVICLEEATITDIEKLTRICSCCGIDSSKVHVFNQQECLMYYIMSQEPEKWRNTSFLFDYREQGLYCYEMRAYKNLKPVTVKADLEKIQGAPLVEQVKAAGTEAEAADRWFMSLAEKRMAGKIVSSVILAGEGFAKLDWAEQFIKSIYAQKSRKVYQVSNLYGMGAALAAYHIAEKHRRFPYCCICAGRISTNVSIFVEEQEKRVQLLLAEAGMNYYDARTSLELNLIEQKDLSLYLRNTGAAEGYYLHLDLSSFLEDGRDRTRIRLAIAFLKEDCMIVRVEDLGFGEIYPSTGQVFQQMYQV